jgi:hypothetical protein
VRGVSNYPLASESRVKGVFIDFFESFHINVYACGTHKGSFIASMVVFAIRSFSTYFVVYTVVRVFMHARFVR